jgi:hypothetical protein
MLAEQCQKISIDSLIQQASFELKLRLLESQIETIGIPLKFSFSKTALGGKRVWFSCPSCNGRVGVLYKHPLLETIACRNCLNLKYRRQRYKGMVEAS